MCSCRTCKGLSCVCGTCPDKDACKYVYTGDCRWIEIGGKP